MKEGRLSKGRSRKEVRFTAAPSKAELPADYATLLADLKQRISNERLRVVLWPTPPWSCSIGTLAK